MQTPYRPDIDGLRAVAVLSVLIFHGFPEVLPSGFVGVDIFFVISGYLISSIIISQVSSDRFSLLEFYTRRIRRIFPALILVLGLSLAIGGRLLLPGAFKSLGLHVAAGATFVSNFLLRSEAGYFDRAAEQKPMLHLWSLSIEEQFYIVWPVLLTIFIRWFRTPLPLIVLGALASFAQGLFLLGDPRASAFYLPTARFWELMSGALIAYLHLSVHVVPGGEAPKGVRFLSRCASRLESSGLLRSLLSASGLTLIVAGLWFVRAGKDFPGWWALLPVGGASCVIAAGSKGVFNRWLLSNKALVFIGLISYPLYLWHWPLLTIAELSAPEVLSKYQRGLLLVAAFLLSLFTYVVVERPIRRGGRGYLKAAGAVCLMIVVGASGWRVYQRDGYPGELPAVVKDILNHRFDSKQAYRFGQCFFELQQVDRHFETCTTTPSLPDAPKVFLWGDSHAAHLYPGLESVVGSRVALSQLTTAECGPLMLGSSVSSKCMERNTEILALIEKERPDVVILASNWGVHGELLTKYLEGTLRRLRELKIKKIVVVGQHPTWKDSVPSLLAQKVKGDPLHRLIKRIPGVLRNDPPQKDAVLRPIVETFGGVFVAPFDVLCNADGCLVVAGDSVDSITTWDDAHLTVAGSRVMAERLKQELP